MELKVAYEVLKGLKNEYIEKYNKIKERAVFDITSEEVIINSLNIAMKLLKKEME